MEELIKYITDNELDLIMTVCNFQCYSIKETVTGYDTVIGMEYFYTNVEGSDATWKEILSEIKIRLRDIRIKAILE